MGKIKVLPITATDIRITRDGRRLLDIDSLSLGTKGCTAIIGPNGAGKSLLIRALAGLQQTDAGLIRWGESAPTRDCQVQVGLLLQRPVLFARSVMANILYALAAAKVPNDEAKRRAQTALERGGLSTLSSTQAGVLSGGEQQRVALARALSLQPAILFLDEPTASVDPSTTLPIEEMLAAAMHDGTQLVLVSHDLGQVRRLADEVILLHHGRILERSEKNAFFERPNSPEGRAYLAGELLL